MVNRASFPVITCSSSYNIVFPLNPSILQTWCRLCWLLSIWWICTVALACTIPSKAGILQGKKGNLVALIVQCVLGHVIAFCICLYHAYTMVMYILPFRLLLDYCRREFIDLLLHKQIFFSTNQDKDLHCPTSVSERLPILGPCAKN